MTKYLIEVKQFKVILCEADWTFMWHVNQYIHRKKSSMFPKGVRFPAWMWKNRPFYDLIEWMRKRASSDGPYLFGMDCYCKDESKAEVRKFLDMVDRNGLAKEFAKSIYPLELPEKWPGTFTSCELLQVALPSDTLTW
jgi:erythromycin esterase-like protein